MKILRVLFNFILLVIVMQNASFIASAQNVQLHYDLGRNIYSAEEAGRQKMTVTFEQFKADRLGSWFYFIDLDLNRKGMIGAYAEMSREFNLATESPFAAHIEYNGGLNGSGAVFQPAALVGISWNGHSGDFSKTWSLQLLYKRYFKGYSNVAFHSVQLTSVWGTTFCAGALTFSGFIDLWRGEKANGHGQLVMLAEPQLWYNINSHLSVGSEIELSNNFIFNTDFSSDKTFFVNPTLALKWNF